MNISLSCIKHSTNLHRANINTVNRQKTTDYSADTVAFKGNPGDEKTLSEDSKQRISHYKFEITKLEWQIEAARRDIKRYSTMSNPDAQMIVRKAEDIIAKCQQGIALCNDLIHCEESK